MTWELLIATTVVVWVLGLIGLVVLLCVEIVRADDRLLDDIDAAADEPTVVLLRAWRDEVHQP